MGALIYGGDRENVIFLNDITFWTGRPVDQGEGAGASRWIPAIREALFREDYEAADKLQLNVQGHNSEYYQPLATLTMTDLNGGEASAYSRRLDIDSALCSDTYTRGGVTYTREYFASCPDSLIAMRLTASQPGRLNCAIKLSAQVPHRVKALGGGQLTMTGHATGDPMESVHFCTIVRATSAGGTHPRHRLDHNHHRCHPSHRLHSQRHELQRSEAAPVREAAPYLERAADRAWHTVNLDYADFRRRHVADYQALFGRFSLRLGDARPDTTRTTDRLLRDYGSRHEADRYLETLYAQYGRYLLISCSRTPGVPANLQGLWANKLRSPWRGNYTVNINLEENYWPAEVANLPEMAMPLDGFIAALAENGSHVARNYYGIARGWCSSHNSDLWAMANPVGEKREKPEWANWNLGERGS